MYIAEKIAKAVSAIDGIPPAAIEATRRCILDAVAAAVAGHFTPGGRAAAEGAIKAWGDGAVPIWFSTARSTELGAVFANSSATSVLDFDDGHRAASGHPGASIVPAVFAAVQADPTLAPRAETAIAIGYEVGLRIAASRDVRTLTTVISGRWCGQGAAAAVGWLKGAPAQVIAEAIAAAGAVAPLMEVANFTQVGNHIKEAIPLATVNGLAGLHLAAAGIRAPLDILDETRYFESAVLLDGLEHLGEDGVPWLIETSYFKPYSACRWIHSSLDGLQKIMAEHSLNAADIANIRVDTFGVAMTLNNQVEPKSLEAAQFSTPFCLGVIAVHGAQALVPMTNPDLLNDLRVREVASRVEVYLDEEMDSFYPRAIPNRIAVSTKDEVFAETVWAPLGEPSNPMGWELLFEKFHALAERQLAPDQVARLRDALDAMRDGDLIPLFVELGSSPHAVGLRQS